MKQFLIFSDVAFSYETQSTALFKGLSASFPPGWTGIVGANGTGKSTLLKLAAGELEPATGGIHNPGKALYCAQRTDEAPAMFAGLLQSTENPSYEIKRMLGLGEDWSERWHNLSHGERKRAQIAVALWLRPLVLAIDEPTNHIDSHARDMLIASLKTYQGIGLLVSHDRELLDTLCSQCLFIDPPDAIMRPGNYSDASLTVNGEEETALRQKEIAKQSYKKLRNEAVSRRNEAAAADRKRSKKGIDKKDHDAKSKIDLARVTGKDGVAGKLLKQMEGRIDQARLKEASIKVKKKYDLGIWIEAERCRRDFIFRIKSGEIPMGASRSLVFPDLAMRPDDRIALTGANGAGKSTLIKFIMDNLKIEPERITYVPQEIDIKSSALIMDEVRNISREQLGRVLTAVSCLGSRPQRLLESLEPSPGEMRKILLALGISRNPYLIVMDEPTNHMDLPSIECLENALSGCPCGLLLVSHDKVFLEHFDCSSWHIDVLPDGNSRLLINSV